MSFANLRQSRRTAAVLVPAIAAWTYLFLVAETATVGRLDEIPLGRAAYSVARTISSKFTDLKSRAKGESEPRNRIVIVAIDEDAIETYGRWPWSRDLMGYLVTRIQNAGAKVVALDAVFPEPDDRIPQGLKELLRKQGLTRLLSSCRDCDLDATFEQAIALNPSKIVLGWGSEFVCQPRFDSSETCEDEAAPVAESFGKFALRNIQVREGWDRRKSPFPTALGPVVNLERFNRRARHSGYFFYEPEPDGIVRKAFLISTLNGKHYPSLALATLQAGMQDELELKIDERGLARGLRLARSGRDIGVSPLGAIAINFRGHAERFPYVSAAALMEQQEPEGGARPDRGLASARVDEVFRDAYVLIGATAVGMRDIRQTPFDMNFPGVEVHATILDNLLSGDWLMPSAGGLGFWIIVLLMTAGMLSYGNLIRRLEALPAILLAVSSFALLIAGDYQLFTRLNQDWNTGFLYLNFVTCTGLVIVAKYMAEEQTKKFVQGAFSKYVSPAVVAEIVRNPEKFQSGGEKRELSILFCDVRGFTSIAERLEAPALASLLKDYLSLMTDVLIEHGATVDKYIGDAIMAFWNAPLEQPDHASRALHAALDMLRTLEGHRWALKRDHGISIEIGIGVNTGIASVGNMGSRTNFSYTAIGDQVNLASRLEGLTKHYGVGAVASRDSLSALGARGKPGVLPEFRVLDRVKVKGKAKAVEIVQLLPATLPAEALERFELGRQRYLGRDWTGAIDAFSRADEILRGDPPSRMFIERCRRLAANPPAPDWDGSWSMDAK